MLAVCLLDNLVSFPTPQVIAKLQNTITTTVIHSFAILHPAKDAKISNE